MGNTMETTLVIGGGWGSIGIMENKMEATIVYGGFYRDNGKQNGNYYSIWLSDPRNTWCSPPNGMGLP